MRERPIGHNRKTKGAKKFYQISGIKSSLFRSFEMPTDKQNRMRDFREIQRSMKMSDRKKDLRDWRDYWGSR